MDVRSRTALELTWSTTDLPALERRLGRIGVAAADHALRWPVATIRLVDEPGAADRLRLDGPDGASAATEGAVASGPTERVEPAVERPAVELLAVGWATVELDRAASEFPFAAFEPATDEPLLGAFARRSTGDGRLLLLEPNTEGLLVATLVRWGEGPAALYLGIPDASASAAAPFAAPSVLSAERVGPFGPSALLLGGSTAGPHVIVVRGRPDHSADPAFAGTIRA